MTHARTHPPRPEHRPDHRGGPLTHPEHQPASPHTPPALAPPALALPAAPAPPALPADGRPELSHTERDPVLSTDDRRPTLTHTAPTHTATPPDPDPDRAARRLPPLPPHLRVRVDLPAVATRYRRAVTLPAAAGIARLYVAALDSALDVPRLVSEVDRLAGALVASRLRYANLAAAARATLTAAEDGDSEPYGYLRDELTHPTPTDSPPAPARARSGRGASGGVRGRR